MILLAQDQLPPREYKNVMAPPDAPFRVYAYHLREGDWNDSAAIVIVAENDQHAIIELKKVLDIRNIKHEVYPDDLVEVDVTKPGAKLIE